jgi:hypothetical protein
MRTDTHIYLRGWFLGDEEDRVSYGCRPDTDCEAEYKKERVSIYRRRIDGLSGSLLQTGHVGVTSNCSPHLGMGTRETLLR